jgi:hypothetical protein
MQSFQNGAPTSHTRHDSVAPGSQVNLKGVHGLIGKNHIATSTPNLPEDSGPKHIPCHVGLPSTRTRAALAHGPGRNTRNNFSPRDAFRKVQGFANGFAVAPSSSGETASEKKMLRSLRQTCIANAAVARKSCQRSPTAAGKATGIQLPDEVL